MSVRRQSRALGVHRSGLYYKPAGESELNLELMRLMDEHYLAHPYKGARRMHTWLSKDLGLHVSRNRIERLFYKVMGLHALLPGPHTSRRHPDHAKHPYLLRELSIERPNQVWAMDITYIPMARGYLYLTAVIDLHSRFVVNWSLSNTMTTEWCMGVVREAIARYGPPEIFNTDQGSQFTAREFTDMLQAEGIRVSMDGKGRATDNAFIERLWRSVKYEHVYLHVREDGLSLYEGLRQYMHFYNTERRHQSLDDEVPKDIYFQVAKAA